MFIEFDREVIDDKDLKAYLLEKNANLPEYRTAVIALILDEDDNILLQRRGPKSRDEVGMLEDVGGAVESSDVTFKDALRREISEEVGNKFNYSIDKLVGGCLLNKFNPRVDKNVNWLFLLYECRYVSGEAICNEDGKALSYEWYKYDDFPKNEIASSTLGFWDFYYKEKRD